MPEKCRRDAEPSKRPRGVERAAARSWTPRAIAADDHVNQRFTANDDHGTISPDPRVTRLVATTTCTDGEWSPSMRRNSCSAAGRPMAVMFAPGAILNQPARTPIALKPIAALGTTNSPASAAESVLVAAQR